MVQIQLQKEYSPHTQIIYMCNFNTMSAMTKHDKKNMTKNDKARYLNIHGPNYDNDDGYDYDLEKYDRNVFY